MNTTDILEKTKKLVSKEREDKHGNKIINHENIARLWSSYLQNKFKLNLVFVLFFEKNSNSFIYSTI